MNDCELAAEIVALLNDGEPVAEVYGLLRKLKSPALTLELDTQWQEWGLTTTHPTLADYRHDAQWSCNQRLSVEENTEISGHIVKVLNAWVRDQRRAENSSDVTIDHVTLLQCAGIVKKSKRTLERWKTKDTAFPTPDVIGEDGNADEWKWSVIRPYLEQKSNRKLPAIFPSHVTK